MSIPVGLRIVHQARLEELKRAITSRDIHDIEFQYDRVVRSWDKINRSETYHVARAEHDDAPAPALGSYEDQMIDAGREHLL